ncbi:MAG: carboxypeptidase-like regulatory domain-containing protein, partial [Bacteroidota bacterium]
MMRLLGYLWVIIFSSVELLAGSISGKVVDENNDPIPGATVKVIGTSIGTVTDSEGLFRIENVKTGRYTLEISFVGFKKVQKPITVQGRSTNINIVLKENVEELDAVVVTSKSESRRRSEQPLQVASINTLMLQAESADAVRILDRTAGVRVRQSGGLGSNTTIQLNGLTGQAVRTYIDGIPRELYGRGLQLNNLPVNAIERIDVYKGVMPVDVGTDALAGGINVITKQAEVDNLDVTYQFGSFNTHIATLNATRILNDKLTVNFSGFYNYSNNNFKIKAPELTQIPVEGGGFLQQDVIVEVERFHNQHQSSSVTGELGIGRVKWADSFSYRIGFNQRIDEIQHGVTVAKPVGEATIEGSGIVQSLKYEKSLFNDKLNVSYFGSYVVATDIANDSTRNIYSWFGNVSGQRQNNFFEVNGTPTRREGKTKSHGHRASFQYDFSDTHSLKASTFLSQQHITGEDPVLLAIVGFDVNTQPSDLLRSISGISYEAKWLDETLETIAYGKYYHYTQEISNVNSDVLGVSNSILQEDATTGYGLGLKYKFSEGIFIRASFEDAVRIP